MTQLAIALDFPDLTTARSWIQRAVMPQSDEIKKRIVLKIGLELYLAEGPRAIEYLHPYGLPIFLDLKLYDIPNTVAGAVRSVGRLGVQYLTIHLSGGQAMLSAAHQAAQEAFSPLELIGVSVLTSTPADSKTQVQVLNYAELANRCGVSWMVCSAYEAQAVLAKFPDLKLVTPGIRFADENPQDQARVMTPDEARSVGSSMLVMGRSLTSSQNPIETIKKAFI